MTQKNKILTKKEIRRKVEDFKKAQKTSNAPKLHVNTDLVLEIYDIIESIQKLPPYPAVQPNDIKPKKPVCRRTISRALELLRKKQVLEHDEKNAQWWVPKYKKKHEEYLLEQKRQNAVYARKLEKSLELAKKHNKELKKGTLDLVTLVEIAKPYLDNLRYCDSDEDWELLIKWFMKIQENKHYQEEAELQEQEYKENAEITKEHPIPEKAEIPKNVKITEPEKLKPIEKTPWDE